MGSGAFCREPEEKLSWEMRREGKHGEGREGKGVWRVRVCARVCVGSEMSVMAEPWVFVLSVPSVNRLESQVQVGVRAKASSFEFLFLALR